MSGGLDSRGSRKDAGAGNAACDQSAHAIGRLEAKLEELKFAADEISAIKSWFPDGHVNVLVADREAEIESVASTAIKQVEESGSPTVFKLDDLLVVVQGESSTVEDVREKFQLRQAIRTHTIAKIVPREQFQISEEAETLFPRLYNSQLSLASVTRFFSMLRESQNGQWPDSKRKLGEFTARVFGDAAGLSETDRLELGEHADGLADLIFNRAITPVEKLSERIITAAMTTLVTDNESTTFTVKEWTKCLRYSSTEESDLASEDPEKYTASLKKAATIIALSALDVFFEMEGLLQFVYAAKDDLEEPVTTLLRDIAYEVYERAENPIISWEHLPAA